MKVTGLSSDTFWKGETEIRGEVTDETGRYRVRILRKGSQIFDYSCSHVDESGRRLSYCSLGCHGKNGTAVLCPHGEAVFWAYEDQERERNLRPVSTSQKVRFMVREYTNREVSRIMGAGEEGQLRLIPVLIFSRDQLRVRFSVEKEKQYPVKDLVTFSQAVEFERPLEYKKGLSIHHSLAAFEEKSRPLALLVMELAGAYREYCAQLRKSAWEAEPVLKELVLGKSARERFFEILEGQVLECRDYRRESRRLKVVRENPPVRFRVEKSGRDGIRFQVPEELMAFLGEKSLFVADREAICICDREYTEALTVLMEYMVMGPDAEPEIFINNRDMPLFYERVLKKLERLRLLDVRDVDLQSFRPWELRCAFYFDSSGPREVSLCPKLSYGDYSFHPLEDEQVPREICRDVPGEFKVSQAITRYFKYTDGGTKDLVIRDDDEAIYRLVSGGIRQFMELGDVLVSEAFRKIRVLPPSSVSVRVKTEGNWLDLEVDTGGIPREELSAVLAEYDRKKKFYRMKNGDFLSLGDDGLLTMLKLSRSLGVEKEFSGSGPIRLPVYRAMFLDSILKEDRSVTFYRDQLFKAVVRGMKAVEDSAFEIPGPLKPVLRGYQKTGYRWLKSLDSYGFGGILADEMGLGKTIQVIALLLDEKKQGGGRTLIVCPASLVYNWEKEIHNFGPELSVAAAAGSQEEREELFKKLTEEAPESRSGEQTDVIITSYDLLKRDLASYQTMEFCFQIIDEAQYIKNPATQAARAVKSIRARTRFALTGTPMENHLGELWSIFDFLMPGFLFTYQKFKRMFETPIVRDGDTEVLGRLRRLTGPFLLRRLKKEVLKELPAKMETVVCARMEGEQKKLYAASAQALRERLQAGDCEDKRERMQILAELMRLRQICCDPSLCFSGYRGGSAKLETCMELLENGIRAGHKILLFSQFTSMLDIIAGRLSKEKTGYYMLTGATPKSRRMQMVSDFQKDDVMVFLISLKAGGTGLNLTAADVVIHYDPWWNVAVQDQATDRAHRIGQENQVTVFRLVTSHTVEENILKLQEQKRALADTVVTEGTGVFSGLTREDLLAMLDA